MAREKGTGAVFYDAARERWVGLIEAGWTSRGTRRRIKVTARTKREAQVKLAAKRREVEAAGAPDEDARAGLTVKAWAEQWLTRQERVLRPSAYTATRSQIRQWVIPAIGHKRLDRLSPADVRAVSAAMEAGPLVKGVRKPLATSSIRRAHGELLRMLADAFQDGHQVPERTREVEYGRRGRGAARRSRSDMDPADARALLTTLDGRADRARWLLALVVGLRPAEARGLTWDRVDLDGAVVRVDWQLQALPYRVARDRTSGFRVPRDFEAIHLHDAFHLVRPKTSAGERVVPLTPSTVEALRAWQDVAPRSPYGLVFCRADGRALDDKMDREAWWALLDLAGLPRRALYEARHQAISRLSEHATDVEITAVAGHSSIASSRTYQHAQIERSRAAMVAAETAMRGAAQIEG